MKELQLMPKELKETKGCSLVTKQYAQSFKEMMAYESLSAKDASVLKDFTARYIIHVVVMYLSAVVLRNL